jgi:hypothetical protein
MENVELRMIAPNTKPETTPPLRPTADSPFAIHHSQFLSFHA